ncbi:MAG: prealbumin-like fold domain-containing protein [Lachnospiraceae bacterium]|nr:prealbumin-like fold domain-containing protein [Lachnospiraceae bacterium]
MSIYFSGQYTALQPNCSGTLTLTTSPDVSTHENKVYYNTAYIVPDQEFDEYSIDSGTYVDGTSDEYTSEPAVKFTAATTVSYGYATTSRKRVTETNNTSNTGVSDAATYAGTYISLGSEDTDFYYTLEVTNGDETSGKQMDSLLIIDRLPESGDTDSYGLTDRDSAFTVKLADDPNFTIQITYTDTYNVKQRINLIEDRDYTVEFTDQTTFTSDDWNGVADNTKWSSNPSASTRSFRIIFNFDSPAVTYIPAGATVQVTFNAEIADGQNIDPGSIAWNSFGYAVSVVGDSAVLEAGTMNVGVRVPGYPVLQKEMDTALTEDKKFQFVIYDSSTYTGYESLTGDALVTALNDDSVDYTIAEVTVKAGETLSEAVSLKDAYVWQKGVVTAYVWTWTAGDSYTVSELEDNDSSFVSWNTTTTTNRYTFTYTSAQNQRLKCLNEITVRYGSITLVKYKTDGTTPLSGVTFLCESADGTTYSESQTTDVDGKVEFSDLPAGNYTITETASASGMQLLAEPIEVTIPLELTKEEVDSYGDDIDLTQAVEKDGKYYFYNLTYHVVNQANLTMPTSGSTTDLLWLYLAMAMVMAGLVLIAWKRKKTVAQ